MWDILLTHYGICEMGPLDLNGDIYTFGVSESIRPHDSERVDVFRYVCIIGANK